MSDYILTSSGELYHAGVKGMKWGVRKDRDAGGPGASKGHRQKRKKVSSPAAKVKSGNQHVNKISGKKVATIVSSTAAVASGALWAASVLVPGAAAEITLARAVLSAGGAAVNLAGSLEAPKSTSRK